MKIKDIDKDFFWIGGKNTCLEVIKSKKREIKEYLCTDKLHKDLLLINNNFKITTQKQLDKIFNKDFKHQGIALKVKKIQTFNLKEFLNYNPNPKNLVALDDISDQGNIGNIVRTCAAFNVNGLIINKKFFQQKSYTFMKAASGASEKINIITTSNIFNDIKYLKKKNFWIYGLSSKSKDYFHKHNFQEKRVFVFGSENKGIKNKILDICDISLKIKIYNNIESLNVSNAVSACMHAINILDDI